jgi:ABC-type glucose/galactose transport system permease subunit
MAAMLKLGRGVAPAYLCERFPTSRRAAGVGFGYSSGALVGCVVEGLSMVGAQGPLYCWD